MSNESIYKQKKKVLFFKEKGKSTYTYIGGSIRYFVCFTHIWDQKICK